MILKQRYLYGKSDIPKIPIEIIEARLKLLSQNLEDLYRFNFETRDTYRINKIMEEIYFFEDEKKYTLEDTQKDT
jgi:hypothetical protein